MTEQQTEMEQMMPVEEMQKLVDHKLYWINKDTGRATPNYRYCKPDAPIYDWFQMGYDGEDEWYVMVA